MDRSFEIADIIVAFIKGEVTPQQLIWLDRWISESEDNKHLFVSLLNESEFRQRLDGQNMLEVEEAFQRVRTRKIQHSKRNNLRYIMVAASIALLLGISGIFVYWMNGQKRTDMIVRKESIFVGKSKACLTLATGERMVLGNRDTILYGNTTNIRIQEKGEIFYEVADSVIPAELEYNMMETPRGAEFQLVLSDGTKVWLNAKSKLRFPVNFGKKERRVQLVGEAYFDVQRNENVPFIVETTRSDVTVLGTEFCVRDYAGRVNQTTLVNGSVAVRDKKGDTYMIKPGQQVNINGDSVRVVEVETMYFTSWKDGYFIFNQVTLNEIMKELSQWYDFDYFFKNTMVADTRLTARLKKYDDIDIILDILSRTGDIYFSRDGRVITIGKY